MPIKVPVVQTGLEASIQAAAKKAGKAMKIDMGAGAKSIEGLSQPLGRITGKADQFTKSMEAANARVLAFGASVGVLSAVSRGFQELVKTTIEVEKQLTSINSILGGTTAQLNKFKKEIFDVARNTEQSFDTVAQAALELSRQGLKAEEVTNRLNDSLILARLSGLGASEAVFGLTAAINSFRKEGISSAEVLNKLSAAAVSAAVSEKDLIEGIKRSGSVATQAGVSFNELVGVITAVQEKTARGGAVIGNSFKTIFTRIQSLEKLKTMQELGVEVEDASGKVLGATKLIQNLAQTLQKLPDATRLQIAENLVGKFQIAPFLAILEDYNSATSTAIRVTEVAAGATTEAYERNIAISKTLSHAINETVLSVKELADTLGAIGVKDNLRGILDFFSNLTANINKVLEGDTLGSKFAKGIVKGIGGVLSGPGLAIFGAIIAKLTLDLAKFGLGSLKTFFGLNRAARDQVTLQGQIASTLLGNKDIQQHILNIERSSLSAEQKKAEQTRFFTIALREQLKIMTTMQGIAVRVAPGVMAGTRGRGAGGYIPNFNATMGYGSEQADINRGVGGAPKGARPVTVPNFNFGGGQRGTMVANSSEYVVPNFGGKSGSAIFNQNMVSSMGLPAGARKIGAAGGYIPNFQRGKSFPANINVAEELVLFVGDRGQDEVRNMWAGRVAGTTKAYTSPSLAEKAKATDVANVRVPIFRMKAKGQNKEPMDIETIKKSLSKNSTTNAENFAKRLSGRKDLPSLTKNQITGLFNPGSFEGFAGSIFEVSLAAILGSKQFLDYASRTETSRIDLPYSSRLFDKFGARGKGRRGAEVKANANTNLVGGAAIKFYDVLGRGRAAAKYKKERLGKFLTKPQAAAMGVSPQAYQAIQKQYGSVSQGSISQWRLARGRIPRSGAEGYIPNFASPLEDAIGREKAAGLPISQIRINQDSSLRGAGNPMGLAVTNMRDEPTGAIPRGAGGYIPNFQGAVPPPRPQMLLGQPLAGPNYNPNKTTPLRPPGVGAAPQRDLLGPIFAVTAAMSALKGATSDAEKGMGKFVNISATAVSSMATIAFAGTAVKGFTTDMAASSNKVTAGFGKALGSLATFGIAYGVISAGLKGLDKAVMEASGANQHSKNTMNRLADAAEGAARKLSDLSNIEKGLLEGQVDLDVKTVQLSTSQISELGGRQTAAGNSVEASLARGKSGFRLARTEVLKAHDKELEAQLAEIFKASRLGNLDLEVVRKVIAEEAAGAAGGVDPAAGKGKSERDILTRDEADKAAIRVLQLLEESQKGITQDKKDFRELLRERGGDVPDLEKLLLGLEKGGAAAQGNIAVLRGRSGRGPGSELLLSEKIKIVKEEIKRIEADIAAAGTEGEREKLELSKALLKAALDRRQAEIVDTSGLAQRIKLAKTLGTLSKDGIRNLETEKFEIELGNKLLKRRFELIKTGIDKLEGLTATTEQRVELEGELSKLTADQLLDADEIKKVLIKVFGFSDKTRVAAERLSQNMADVVKAGDGAVVKMNELDLSTRRAADNTDRIKDNLDAARTFLDIQISKDAFGAIFGANENIATIDERRRQAQRTLDRGGLNPEQREGLQRQIRGLNFGAATEQARIKDARLTEKVRGFDLPITNKTRQGAEALRLGGFDQDTLAIFMKQSRQRAQETLAAAKTRKEAFAIIDASLEGLTGTELATAKKRVEAFKQEIKLSQQSTEATLAQSKAELELIGARIKTSRDLNESARQLREVGLGGRARGVQRRAQAVATGRGDIDPALQQEVIDLKRSGLDRLLESPDFTPLLQADALNESLKNAALNFKNTMSDAMVDSIIQGGNLGDILRSAATDFFTMISKAYMKSAVDTIVGSGLGGLGALFGARAGGGLITGGSGNRDDVPTLLTGGEFVIRKSAVEKYGAGFFEGLNTGGVGQMARGGLYSPGTYGQGAISGKKNLLDFATQSFTGGQFDQIGGGAGFGSASLEPQSAALTMFGRRNSPLFQREQQSKQQAFGLYTQQIQHEQQLKEQEKQQRKQLFGSIIAAAGAAAFSGLVNKMTTGNFAGMKPNPNQKGILKAGAVGGGAGGAANVFSGSAAGGSLHLPQIGGILDHHSSMINELVNSVMSFSREGKQHFRMDGRVFDENSQLVGGGGNGQVLPNRLERERQMNMVPIARQRAAGGYISPTAGVDTVPSMLSGGEFVMNAAATQRMGRGNLAALNSGGGGGGDDGAVVARLDELIAVTDGSGETVINITVNSDGTESQDTQGGQEDQHNLATKIKDVVRATIDEEKRLGGSLRRI